MNRIGKGPTLTWVFIGLAVALTVITISMSSYDTFLAENNATVGSQYSSTYQNLSDDASELLGYKEDLTNWDKITKIFSATALTTVFVTGLSAIGTFFSMITLTNGILETAKTVIPGLDALIGLLIVIISVFISMKLIQARRGTGAIS